jgi:hypothetical protein
LELINMCFRMRPSRRYRFGSSHMKAMTHLQSHLCKVENCLRKTIQPSQVCTKASKWGQMSWWHLGEVRTDQLFYEGWVRKRQRDISYMATRSIASMKP